MQGGTPATSSTNHLSHEKNTLIPSHYTGWQIAIPTLGHNLLSTKIPNKAVAV
jgi:hypothetical protein